MRALRMVLSVVLGLIAVTFIIASVSLAIGGDPWQFLLAAMFAAVLYGAWKLWPPKKQAAPDTHHAPSVPAHQAAPTPPAPAPMVAPTGASEAPSAGVPMTYSTPETARDVTAPALHQPTTPPPGRATAAATGPTPQPAASHPAPEPAPAPPMPVGPVGPTVIDLPRADGTNLMGIADFLDGVEQVLNARPVGQVPDWAAGVDVPCILTPVQDGPSLVAVDAEDVFGIRHRIGYLPVEMGRAYSPRVLELDQHDAVLGAVVWMLRNGTGGAYANIRIAPRPEA